MRFALTQRQHLADIVLAALVRRKPIPGIVDDIPELLPGLDVFLQGYNECATERPPGFGYVPPIPVSRIRDWIARHGGDEVFEETALHHIQHLDAVFREWAEEQKPDAGQSKPNNTRTRIGDTEQPKPR